MIHTSCLYGTHSHPSELGLSPSHKAKLATRSEIVPDDMYTFSVPVQLVDNLFDEATQAVVNISAIASHRARRKNGDCTHVPTTKDEQIRILRDDPIYDPFLFEVSQLGVRFVRCDDIWDLFRLQGLLFVVIRRFKSCTQYLSMYEHRS
jgi:hypothetical protein